MRNYQIKKIIGILLLVSIVFNSVIVTTPINIKAQKVDNTSEEMTETVESIEDKEISEDALSLIGKMVNAENCQNWDEYPQYWRAEYCKFLKNALHNEAYLKNRTGVSNVKSAKVVMCEKVTDSSQVDIAEYIDYQDVQVYLVGIDYEVYETQESFYDGVNYRYYIIGKENGIYKVLDVTEAQIDYLEEVVSNEERGVVVYEAEQHTNKDLEVQIQNREDRIAEGACSETSYIESNEGYEKLGNVKTFSGITNMAYVPTNNMYYLCGWRGSHRATTKCSCARAARKLKVQANYSANKAIDNDGDGIIEVGKKVYLKNVLFCEMVVSETNNKAALKAVMICAQEYALWNMRYFAKYPNLGYDVKDTPSDQKFVYGTYNSNEKVYRDKVDEVYEAVKDVHIHTGSNSSLFETGYVDTRSTDKDSYGTLYQDRALSLSKQGYTYKKILKDAYDNSSQMGISNIGTISFSSFQ